MCQISAGKEMNFTPCTEANKNTNTVINGVWIWS